MKEHDIARQQPRRDRLIRERIHDPYKARAKLPARAVCPQCGAAYEAGRYVDLSQCECGQVTIIVQKSSIE